MTITSAGGDTASAKTAAYNTAWTAPGDETAAAAAAAVTAVTDPANSTVNVAGATISASGMASALKDQDFTLSHGTTAQYTVDGSTHAVSYDADGTGGTGAAVDAYVDSNGAITAAASQKVDYYAQKDGSVTNTTGSSMYKTEAGKLTTESTTAAETTADPLKALDDAISQIDKFRSSLGAVQNRLDSAVTNLNNTTTNLSEAQSRIQDADYATEVSNMSKAQIIQQAGNSVLAKANQVPQQVLSLLQG